MIKDARAQVDFIAALRLEASFQPGSLVETPVAHTKTHDSAQLRQRLEAIRTLSLRARGLTLKMEMTKANKVSECDSSFPTQRPVAQSLTIGRGTILSHSFSFDENSTDEVAADIL